MLIGLYSTTKLMQSSKSLFQSMTDDCKVPMWYDLQCFFKIRRPATETLIDGYANLRYEHQMEIRKQLGKEW